MDPRDYGARVTAPARTTFHRWRRRLRARCDRCETTLAEWRRLAGLDLCGDCFELEYRELGVGA